MEIRRDIQLISDLDGSAASLVRAVAEERRTLVFTDDGEAKAVLMDASSYDNWRNTAALLRLIAQSEAEIEEGKLVPQDEAFSRAARVIERVQSGS